jgi:CubicO group peptidase (beta-lactamase class C family)
MTTTRRLLAALALCLIAARAPAAQLPTATAEEVGLARLERIDAFFQAEVAARRLPGAVVMLARDGKVVHHAAYGMRDPASGAPMALDSIFRIYSMTKPVTAVGVLMLMEEGRLRLADPLSRYLPAFAKPRVLVDGAEVPAAREITILDLLRHTSGMTYGVFGNTPVDRMMREAGLNDPAMKHRLTDMQVAAEMAKLPLLQQPGTQWQYGRSTDILLAVVEAVSGQRGDAFLQQRIFGPLGMVDTHFNLPPDKLGRMAEAGPDPATGQTPSLTDVRQPRLFLGGGEGLLSTATDYMRFAQMLAQGGSLDGVRILSRKTVALMAADHMSPEIGRGPGYLPGPGHGFGLTVAVRTAEGQASVPGSVGEYYWGGYAGTQFWIDPAERLVPVMMIQAPLQSRWVRGAFRALVYQAIED